MESNQLDIPAGKSDIEKLTLRVTTEAAGRLRELAARMGIPQGFAFERVISERDKARRVARKYRRKLRALERAGFKNSNANLDAKTERLGAQMDGSSVSYSPHNIDLVLPHLGPVTGALKRAAGEHEKAQDAFLSSLKETTTAAIKAVQSFSTIAVDAREAITHIAQVKSASQAIFELQDRQLKSKLDDIGKGLNNKIESERKGYDELILRKEKHVDDLLKHAEKLSAAYSNSFTEGVGQLAPEVEKIRVKICSEVDKVARFNRLSIGIAGAVFLAGLALFYFYKPVVEKWDEHQQVSAAVTAVTSEYSKKIAAAETKATELQTALDQMKDGEVKFRKQAKIEAEIEVRKDVEKMRLRSFEIAVQKVQKELTDANRRIGELQSRNVDLRTKLIKNCSWWCSGDYSPNNGELQ